jgi:diguanylate cyclase (GGDEF)-like protein/PAS domain S-box-containing protein
MAAALVMGFAIAGMHYTAMAAADFTMVDHAPAMADPVIQPAVLALSVISATSVLLLLALLTAYFDRKLATLTAREAAALRQSEERHRALIRNASDIVAILDPDGIFIYEGSSALKVLGYRTEELVGRPLIGLVRPEQVAETQRLLQSILSEGGAQVAFELEARHRDGTWRNFEVVGKNLTEEPAIGGIVVNLRDITERKRLMAALEKLSETDCLTGALNRRGFLRLAEREFDRIRRAGRPLSIIMIDIDHFKQVNDSYGHAAGDLVLATVAEQCRTHIRKSDLLARFGGEEFIVMMSDGTPDEAHGIVERLRRAIHVARLSTIKGEVSVTASFGIACIDASAVDLETAIRLSDEALYEAKNAGRNCVKVRAAAGG